MQVMRRTDETIGLPPRAPQATPLDLSKRFPTKAPDAADSSLPDLTTPAAQFVKAILVNRKPTRQERVVEDAVAAGAQSAREETARQQKMTGAPAGRRDDADDDADASQPPTGPTEHATTARTDDAAERDMSSEAYNEQWAEELTAAFASISDGRTRRSKAAPARSTPPRTIDVVVHGSDGRVSVRLTGKAGRPKQKGSKGHSKGARRKGPDIAPWIATPFINDEEENDQWYKDEMKKLHDFGGPHIGSTPTNDNPGVPVWLRMKSKDHKDIFRGPDDSSYSPFEGYVPSLADWWSHPVKFLKDVYEKHNFSLLCNAGLALSIIGS